MDETEDENFEDGKINTPKRSKSEAESRLINETNVKPWPRDDVIGDIALTDETTCGFWCLKGSFLQKFASKKMYVLLYGLLGCIDFAAFAYYNGTLTTLEKRFKIPSQTSGLIVAACEFPHIVLGVFLSYYGGKGHRPRWMAFGMSTIFIFYILSVLPQVLYGSGDDALQLTQEHGAKSDANLTAYLADKQKRRGLCEPDKDEGCTDETSGFFYPQVILFAAHFLRGIGLCIFACLGVIYLDDNIKKSKAPALISLTYFLRLLGPAVGYTLASFCLEFYISPNLTPTITPDDPRWLGAWWLGYIILGTMQLIIFLPLGMFPRTLPRAAARREIALEARKGKTEPACEDPPPSFKDMMATIKKLLKNKIYVFNNLAAFFYVTGYTPYWMFMPKYIETQFKRSASVSSFVTGTVGIVFSALGVLTSGAVIGKFKPSARWLAAWNVLVGIVSVLGMLSYGYLGCDNQDLTRVDSATGELNVTSTCNIDCHCDYVSFSPVCSEDSEPFISPCHAGCMNHAIRNETKGTVIEGDCQIGCTTPFYIFLAIVCVLKFAGATGIASNFLVGLRCVDEKDKSTAMGLSEAALSLFSFLPAPIFFGRMLDTTCLVWGKTCTGTGNCWLYNGYEMRSIINTAAAVLVGIGTVLDVVVWHLVKELKIFDNADKKNSNRK